MKLLSKLKNQVARFNRDESGIVTVEAIMVFPLLLWIMAFTFNYFDGFRQSASNLKAANTISDLISRETEEITDIYIDSMQELMEKMVNNGTEMNIRISVLSYDDTSKVHYVRWSTVRGFDAGWTNDTIVQIKNDLPPMPDEDTLILVETANAFRPVFRTGFADVTFSNFVFTRPRFTNEVAADCESPAFGEHCGEFL